MANAWHQPFDPVPITKITNWEYALGDRGLSSVFDGSNDWKPDGRTLLWDDDLYIVWFRTVWTVPTEYAGKTLVLSIEARATREVWVDGEPLDPTGVIATDAVAGREYRIVIRGDRGRRPGTILRSEVRSFPRGYERWLSTRRTVLALAASHKEFAAEVALWNRFLAARPDARYVDAVLSALAPVLSASSFSDDAIEAALRNLSTLRGTLTDDAPFVATPYLQFPKPDGITIRFESLFDRTSELHLTHLDGAEHVFRNESPTRFHRFVLDGLAADTEYEYSVAAGNVTAGPFRFRTAPTDSVSDGREITIAMWGDSHYGPTILEAMLERISEAKPDLIVTAGDMIGDGINEYEWVDHYFTPLRGVSPHVPTHFPVGNHDQGSWMKDPEYRGRNPYLDARFDPVGTEPGSSPYAYSFMFAGVYIVCVDPLHGDQGAASGLSKGTPQYEWLRRDLEKHADARWKLLFVHEPPYCETWEGNYYDGEEPLRQDIVPMLEEFGVDLVVSGHAHTYERGLPHPPYDPETGEGNTVAYLITGGGGALLDNRKNREWPQIDIPPHRVQPTDDIKRNDHGEYYRYHYCIAKISATKLETTAYWVRTDGTIIDVLDTFTLRKGVPRRANPEHAE